MTIIDTPPPPAAIALALDAHSGPLARISADLLPDEVRARRRLAHVKRRMVFGFVALALVIGLGDTLARQQTSKAEDALAAANQRNGALNQQVTRFAAVTGVQGDTQQITTQLTQAMAGDVPWAKLVATMQRLAPRGLALTGMNAATGAGGASGAPAPTAPVAPGATSSTAAPVGTLSLTGQAASYRDVADYAGALAGVPGLTGVTPTTAATTDTSHTITFTITASLTAAVQGGRYATTAPRTGTAAAPVAATSGAPTASAPSNTAAAPPAGPTTTASAPVGN
ncbi:hypothetical protein [uncultured Jatrophihabitans sp.]|uniref:hypothetical protein n=1 Tax=uncultured Jatrophihabitans sp. TaxID=1610747 RepID=UPI0035CABEBB